MTNTCSGCEQLLAVSAKAHCPRCSWVVCSCGTITDARNGNATHKPDRPIEP